MNCFRVTFHALIIAVVLSLSGWTTFGQESPVVQNDTLSTGGVFGYDSEQILLGEESSTVESVAWETEAIPPSLVPSHIRQSPVDAMRSPDGALPGVGRAGRSNRAEVRKTFYCETRFRRNSGQSSLPADSLLLGDPLVSVLRLKVNPFAAWNMHFVLAKQSGEPYRNASISGSLSYSGTPFDQVIIGDFRFRAGLGLVLSGSQTSFGEGSFRGLRSESGLVPYFGTGPVGFFRGGAVQLKARVMKGTLGLAALVSGRGLAATIQDDGTVSSIDWSGYQRTESEARKQAQLHETLAGFHASWSVPGCGSVGVTWYRSKYDRRISPRSGIGFRGDKSEVTGVDGKVAIGTAALFAELARGERGRCSVLAGVKALPAEQTSLVVLVRSYAAGFSNPHASSFGQHSDGGNERGVFLGFSTWPLPHIEIEGSVDLYRFPAATSTNSLPSSGRLAGLRCIVHTIRGIIANLRIQVRQTMETRIVQGEGRVPARREVDRERLRVSGILHLPVSDGFSVRCRSSAVSFRSGYGLPSSHGYSLSVSGFYKTETFGFQCSTGLFSADTYDAAVVEIEPDLGRPATGISCYGSGSRMSLWVAYEPLEWLQVSGKLGITFTAWKPVEGRPMDSVPPQTSLGFSSRIVL